VPSSLPYPRMAWTPVRSGRQKRFAVTSRGRGGPGSVLLKEQSPSRRSPGGRGDEGAGGREGGVTGVTVGTVVGRDDISNRKSGRKSPAGKSAALSPSPPPHPLCSSFLLPFLYRIPFPPVCLPFYPARLSAEAFLCPPSNRVIRVRRWPCFQRISGCIAEDAESSPVKIGCSMSADEHADERIAVSRSFGDRVHPRSQAIIPTSEDSIHPRGSSSCEWSDFKLRSRAEGNPL